MKEQILCRLKQIEKEEHVKILLAVESGSRAWGFASPDSDYDVRFIYVRPKNAYLRLGEMRDVIEITPDGVFDINGWELRKTLRLLYRSNPTLFEWFSSPIVYMETDFSQRFRAVMADYFSEKKALYHYISMAEGNYREYLRGDLVKAKKYFYVLRPILACRWIMDRGTPPPMLFSALAAAELPAALEKDVGYLLDLKIHAPEVKMIPRIPALDAYMDGQIADIKARIAGMEEHSRGWETLDALFLETVEKTAILQT